MRFFTLILLLIFPLMGGADEAVFDHPLTAQSQQHLDCISQTIGQANVMRGAFEQVRLMKMLKRPLKSSGDFIFSKKNGLMWRIKKPFAVDVIMSDGKLIQRSPGRAAQVLDANDNPSARIMADVFTALFSQDQKTLNRYFDQFFLESESSWLLGLTPKDKSLGQVMVRVVIEGADKIQRIVIKERGGDQTEITLLNVQNLMDESTVSDAFIVTP